jgi:acetate kinase
LRRGPRGGRIIIAHLGSGASLCALKDGRSVDTSMGYSPLDGLVMATRCGALDPGILLRLMRDGVPVDALEDLLYRRAGLLGVSGVSSDMRILLASPNPEAAGAVDLFVFRLAREIAAMAASLEGVEGIVFTAGIGENAPEIRRRVAERLGWLGLRLDPAANATGAITISSPGSCISCWVIPTDEEWIIARHTLGCLVPVA